MKIKKNRLFEESDFFDYGKSFLIELNYPSSKYHGSILSATSDSQPYMRGWVWLDALELPRRFSIRWTHLLKTTETKERLTSIPSKHKDIVFVDFLGYQLKVGDILFGEGKLIKVINLKSTCEIKILYPRTLAALHYSYNYKVNSIKKFLYIEDPTLILLKT